MHIRVGRLVARQRGLAHDIDIMLLETWDPIRKKYVLYRRAEEHAQDCERHPFGQIPRRIFLDTDVINLLVKYSDHVFECLPLPADIEFTRAIDVEALMHVFHVGARAHWDLVGSVKTLDELSQTRSAELREDLLDYGVSLVDQRPDSEDRKFAQDFARRLSTSALMEALPGKGDRELLGQAIGLGCDVFCTCDRKTILSKRDKLQQLPIRIRSPAEWWASVKPWAGLWG